MHTVGKLFVILMVSLGLAACSSTGTKSGGPAGVEDHTGAAGDTYGAETQGLGADGSMGGTAFTDPSSPLSQRVIYFEFDSANVREADREVLAAHANYLANNPMSAVTLEGHADERGSREYNIGLGDRRAQAVKRLLEFQGVNPAQISTVSYGEEKPAVEGHTESDWAQNRRVEIVYTGQ
jgi:peptidoglycan-associated lipoprotein